ncbi:Hypothetical_protein [Hexamita inflata]|uniref:Hypothetical_protein n=1 Tax=Hexamita inflata TaxID=28002 RepID=A0ABP1H9C7_9EUKA
MVEDRIRVIGVKNMQSNVLRILTIFIFPYEFIKYWLEQNFKYHFPSPHCFGRVFNSNPRIEQHSQQLHLLVWLNGLELNHIYEAETCYDAHERSPTYSKRVWPDRIQLCCHPFKEQENILGSQKK